MMRKVGSGFPLFLFYDFTLSFYDIFIKNVFFRLILTLKAPDNRLRQILSLNPHEKPNVCF